MPCFLIADVTVTDESWVPSYAAVAHDIAAKHGGKYLSRSARIETIEGVDPGSTLIAVIEFPDRASLRAFIDDPEYAPHSAARQAGANSLFRVIDDSDRRRHDPLSDKRLEHSSTSSAMRPGTVIET